MIYKKLSLILLAITLICLLLIQYISYSEDSQIKADLNQHPFYSHYQFNTGQQTINMAIQPLGVPIGAVAELIKRDKILHAKLKELGFKLRFYNFLSGKDINYFWDKGIDIGMGGDMPTLVSVANHDTVITSLFKQEFTSIVAKEYSLLTDLENNKIALPFGSNAHYSVLRALKLENISSDNVDLINMDIHEYADALKHGKIDAFAAWEPFPSLAREKYPEFVVIHKGLSTAYLFFANKLTKEHPKVVHLLLAAQVRAMRWMNQSRKNLFQISEWQLQAYEAFLHKKSPLTVGKNAELIRNGLLSITDTPAIPEKSLIEGGFLQQAFLFLQAMNKINKSVDWHEIKNGFNVEFLAAVLVNKKHYQLEVFDYQQGSHE